MKKILFVLLIFSVGVVNAQTFEGVIVYEVAYKTGDAARDKQIGQMLGTKQEYYYKGANFKSVVNGSFAEFQLNISSTYRLYTKFADNDTLYWQDVRKDLDPTKEVKLLPKREKVMGLDCSIVQVKSQAGTSTYYFNSKYPIDPKLFKDHKLEAWGDVLTLMKALPLKITFETKEFTMISTAIEVKPQKLGDSVFALPDGPEKEGML